jgi:hypothetical protein
VAGEGMNQYIITEELIDYMSTRVGMNKEIWDKLRSHPYQSERDKLAELEQWAWDNRSVFFNNNAYNPLLEKLKELRQQAGEP